MTHAVRPLAEVRLADAADVGAKAAGLGELIGAGVRVPDGVVLTAAAADLPPDQRAAALYDAADALASGLFAVRSSGVAEDGVERSYAGMYESVLNVPASELPAAADRVLASAHGARVGQYESNGHGAMAVIVQRMVAPVAAGVALTADPISGDRRTCVVTAVRGTGDRLVSGAAIGDEWWVRDGRASARRQPERAIDGRQATRVAGEARRIAAARGTPQDVEWAIDAEGILWILQARPMTALPPDVSWDPPARGAYTRTYRFGEWIGEPVTPLFESWLLTLMEDRLAVLNREWIGQRAPRPYHVVVNGWYFYSLNVVSGPALLRSLPAILWTLVREPRRVAVALPPTARFSVPLYEREWREDLLPRYRAAVASAESRLATQPVAELPALVDELADLAGAYFSSICVLAASASKLEINLARFYRRHLAGALGGSHLPLLAGLEPPADPGRHAVVSLDWWHPPSPLSGLAPTPEDHRRLVETREAAEKAAAEALASSPRRLRTFRTLLADAQRLARVREEQTRELTTPWPTMRRAVLRIGEELVARGAIADLDDVFFLTRPEALAALKGRAPPATVDTADRRRTRDEQARLVPPLLIGRINPMLKKMWDGFPRLVGAAPSDRALVTGTPASAGRAIGTVRIVRGLHEFHQLEPGEILVATLTAPGWTPLFTRAAAVVTDVGSPSSHASIIAREYGIPAVVGCGDATARLRTGMQVTVDGNTGNVAPA